MTSRSEPRGIRTSSYLVRLWTEPRRLQGLREPVRCYVRNLRTGEEHYLSDPLTIGELLSEMPGAADAEPDRSLGNAGREPA